MTVMAGGDRLQCPRCGRRVKPSYLSAHNRTWSCLLYAYEVWKLFLLPRQSKRVWRKHPLWSELDRCGIQLSLLPYDSRCKAQGLGSHKKRAFYVVAVDGENRPKLQALCRATGLDWPSDYPMLPKEYVRRCESVSVAPARKEEVRRDGFRVGGSGLPIYGECHLDRIHRAIVRVTKNLDAQALRVLLALEKASQVQAGGEMYGKVCSLRQGSHGHAPPHGAGAVLQDLRADSGQHPPGVGTAVCDRLRF